MRIEDVDQSRVKRARFNDDGDCIEVEYYRDRPAPIATFDSFGGAKDPVPDPPASLEQYQEQISRLDKMVNPDVSDDDILMDPMAGIKEAE